ncbi:MAG TPA: U32 family peptidase [Thermohalobaculum sp.]|nr:U32 family peptidase [Thermohalobaculum sp.]
MTELTLGPILFHWPAEQKRDFYFRVADEAPVGTVYLGEVVCSKREPFFAPHLPEVAERLTRAGKTVVFSTLAEAMIKRERKMIAEMCGQDDFAVEANDNAALFHLRGKPHRVGPFINAYNEETLAVLAAKGATNVTLPAELPGASVAVMAAKARELGVGIEVQVHGRMPLALSARCYHARAHGRVKDNCQFVCENDPDGMALTTLDGQPFLAINGIQTLSHTCLNLASELAALDRMGVGAFRLSPHSGDMVAVARIFRALADGEIGPGEATARLGETGLDAPFANGFYHRQPGYRQVAGTARH